MLDGKTDDPAWKNAQVIDKFLEYDPKPGAETRFKTEVRVVHDDKYLYVLARMFDPAPDSISRCSAAATCARSRSSSSS